MPAAGQVERPEIAPAPSVTVAILPAGTTLEDLGRVPGLSPGLMSAGIGSVSAKQTYTDISAGSRESPPSDAVPGLLALTLARAGVPPAAARTIRVPLGALTGLAAGLRGDDLLIAFAAPPPGKDQGLAIGIAGTGFDGNLTSDSTRTDGYVLATDIAPTVLDRLGVAIPDEMNGEPIRDEGTVDVDAVEDRARRMEAIPERRGAVVIGSIAAWIGLAAAVALIAPPLRRGALAWLGLAIAYMPLMLLVGAALQPSALTEGLLVGLGAAALAAATVRLAPGWWGLTIACGATTIAYGIDVIAGSDLTSLSLLGPNPIYGARFYGIGNELEALIAVMVPAAVGAGLTARADSGRRPTGRRAAAAFLIAGGAAGIVFAAGRFGADVGAAIVLPLGAAVAAALIHAETPSTFLDRGHIATPKQVGPRVVVVGVGAAVAGLAAIALIDLVSGGNAHLTRSVLDAGGAGELADAAERRLRLSAHDFGQAAGNPLFWLVAAAIVAAATQWRRIDDRLRAAPPARAGLIGGCAAVAAGVLVNDSGASFLVVGAVALGAFLAFSWSQMSRA